MPTTSLVFSELSSASNTITRSYKHSRSRNTSLPTLASQSLILRSLLSLQYSPTVSTSINMVGRNILAAATVYFALSTALALPKDKDGDDGKHHNGGDDEKPHLPIKPGRPNDKDCSSTIPYPTGDPTSYDFATGTGYSTGVVPTGSPSRSSAAMASSRRRSCRGSRRACATTRFEKSG